MSARESILVTGGAGYVGAHFARAAHDAGSRVVVIDDLSGVRDWPALPPGIDRVRGDIRDRDRVAALIQERRFTSVVHFAGRTCVGESIRDPAIYFEQNVTRSLALLDVVRRFELPVVFSSSAAVYGEPERLPAAETGRCAPVNPYGATKLAVEHALAAYGTAYGIKWAALRYFNAAGAHPDGTLRESHDPETHLIPVAIDAALGRRAALTVLGTDYPTHDGTCKRDFVHVCDLADAHLVALDNLDWRSLGALNLGSGVGYTVFEVIAAVSRAVGHDVPCELGARRAGDPPKLVADDAVAREIIAWNPWRSSLDAIVDDAVRSRRDP